MTRRPAAKTALTLLVVAALCLAGAGAAVAAPVAVTPDKGLWQTDGRVDAVTYSADGSVLYAGGTFHHLCPALQTTCDGTEAADVAIDNLAAFNASTGAPITTWRPQPDNEVQALAPSSSGILYAGGIFNVVSGQNHRKLAAITASTGTAIAGWKPVVSASVKAVALSPDQSVVYLGGAFTTVDTVARNLLAAVSAYSAAKPAEVLQPWAPEPSGSATVDKSVAVPATISSLTVRSDGQVYAAGVFTSIGGLNRHNVAALSPGTAGGTATAVSAFAPTEPDYVVLNVTLTRDGSTLFANGRGPGGFLWAMDSTSGAQLWSRKMDGDVQAAVATDTLIYVGGHFDFISLTGSSVRDERHHLAAFDTLTGKTDSWNPRANSDHGVFGMAWAPAHIAAGGDFTAVQSLAHSGLVQFTGGSTVAPSAIADLSATSTAKGTVNLTWTAADDADSPTLTYRIYRRPAGGTFAALDTISGPSLSGGGGTLTFADTTGTIGSSYDYLVRAADPVFLGPAGNTAGPVIVAGDQFPPGVPSGVTAVAAGPGNATVSWTGGTDADDSSLTYTVNRISGTTSTPAGTVTGAPSATLSFTDSIAAGGTFRYTVQASDPAGISAPSDASGAVTIAADVGKPSVPAGLATASTTPNSVVLNWTASTDSDQTPAQLSYQVLRKVSSATGTGSVIGQTQPGQTTYTDTGDGTTAPLPGQSYTYYVKSTDGPYLSAVSASSKLTVFSSIFTDDLSTLSAWTVAATGNGASLDPALGATAAPSAHLVGQVTPAKLTGYANRTFGAAYRTACVKEAVSIAAFDPSTTAATTLVRLFSTAGTSIARLYLDRKGQLWVRSDWGSAANLTSVTIPGDGTWHTIQLCATVNPSAPETGSLTVYYDGPKIATLPGVDNSADLLSSVDIGERSAGTFTLNVDDVSAGTSVR